MYVCLEGEGREGSGRSGPSVTIAEIRSFWTPSYSVMYSFHWLNTRATIDTFGVDWPLMTKPLSFTGMCRRISEDSYSRTCRLLLVRRISIHHSPLVTSQSRGWTRIGRSLAFDGYRVIVCFRVPRCRRRTSGFGSSSFPWSPTLSSLDTRVKGKRFGISSSCLWARRGSEEMACCMLFSREFLHCSISSSVSACQKTSSATRSAQLLFKKCSEFARNLFGPRRSAWMTCLLLLV